VNNVSENDDISASGVLKTEHQTQDTAEQARRFDDYYLHLCHLRVSFARQVQKSGTDEQYGFDPDQNIGRQEKAHNDPAAEREHTHPDRAEQMTVPTQHRITSEKITLHCL